MTYEQALTYANKLCRGFPFTARSKELKEYNELCKSLIEEKIKDKIVEPNVGRWGIWQASSSKLINTEKTND